MSIDSTIALLILPGFLILEYRIIYGAFSATS